MPTESFRFVHAASLLLDEQLQHTGEIPAALKHLVSRAPRGAFDRVIETCLSRQVDALLLVGDSFNANEIGLAGPVQLIRGLERLAPDVPVFIMPGTLDPWSAWLPGIPVGEHVYRLGFDADLTIPLSRDNFPLAELQGFPHGELAQAREVSDETAMKAAADAPWRLGLWADSLPVGVSENIHYWALGGAGERETRSWGKGWAHHPGSTQGVLPTHLGPHGCSLVEIDPSGAVHTEFIPTAPVRYEVVSLALAPGMNVAAVEQAAIRELQTPPRYASDRVWLIEWRCTGLPLPADRQPPWHSSEFLARIARGAGLDGITLLTRCVSTGTAALPPRETDQPLETELLQTLRARTAAPGWSPRAVVRHSPLRDTEWAEALSAVADRRIPAEIAALAEHVTRGWIGSQQELPA